MKVVAFPQTDGCGLYRLRHPIAVLRAQGHDVTPRYDSLREIGFRHESGNQRATAVDIEADVVVIQRPLDMALVQKIPLMQKQGIAVVVEIDDDFESLPKGHPARRDSAPHRAKVTVGDVKLPGLTDRLMMGAVSHMPHIAAKGAGEFNPTLDIESGHDRSRRWLKQACDIADLVTVSTPALAEVYGSHGRVRVLRNLVPQSYLDIKADRTGYWLGWTGSTDQHVNDLRAVESAVADVLAVNKPWGFRVVGPEKDAADQLGVKVEATGWVEHAHHPAAYARLDVAIAPLQMSKFNEAKSWLKPLEAAALGVPCVGSPTSEYRRAETLGLCWTAATPRDWAELLTHLIRNPASRHNRAELARAAAAGLTYEQHAPQWLEAWDQAIQNHRHRRAA